MCGKDEKKFYRLIYNGYNRPKAIEFDGGETEMWKKTITSNVGAKRTEEVSNAFGFKSDISFIQCFRANAAVSNWETPCMGAYHLCSFWEKILHFLENWLVV